MVRMGYLAITQSREVLLLDGPHLATKTVLKYENGSSMIGSREKLLLTTNTKINKGDDLDTLLFFL